MVSHVIVSLNSIEQSSSSGQYKLFLCICFPQIGVLLFSNKCLVRDHVSNAKKINVLVFCGIVKKCHKLLKHMFMSTSVRLKLLF